MSSSKVAIAIDVDNLLISSAEAGQPFQGYSMRSGFENMFAWLRSFAVIDRIYLYVSMGQCLKHDELFHEIWEKCKGDFIFEMVYCPRRRSEETGGLVDNVDQHLIWHTRRMAPSFQGIEYFCLASGDLDYSPMLWELKREFGLKIGFILGSKRSFSGAYKQMKLAGTHPRTGEELIHYFLPRKAKT